MYRLIIADDQSIECRALEHKIKSEMPEIEILPSVYDGLKLLKSVEEERPDIAIVDINMPGLSGLETIEILMMKKISLKVIIHTSYSEFSYAQKAIQLGAIEYLLKPSSAEEVVAAVRKACQILDRERRIEHEISRTRETINDMTDLSAGRWMMSLFLRQRDEECYKEFFQHYPQAERGGVFTAWKAAGEKKILPEGWNWGETERVILKQMRQYCGCVGMRYKDVYYMFLFPENVSEEYEDSVLEITDAVCKQLKEMGTSFAVGVSRWKNGTEPWENGLYEARIALQGKQNPGVYFFRYGKTIDKKMVLSDLCEEAVSLIMEGRVEDCVSMIQERAAIGQTDEGQEMMELFKVQALEFILRLRHELGILREQPELRMQGSVFSGEYQKLSSVQEIFNWLQRRMEDMCQKIKDEKEDSDYIRKAVLYMNEHFSQDISLEDVGQQVGISSFYLSRLLKQERKTTFVEILTDIRLQTALTLLKEGRLSVKEVCGQSGYPNMSYFYKVLKKVTGMSVGIWKRYL